MGGKLVARTPIRIERVVKGINKTLIIFGSNFSTGGSVLINNNPPIGISKWTDSMIEVSVDDSTLKNWRTIEVITNESTQARYEREAPYVVYTQPSQGAKGVPVDTRTIVAVFSEPMKREIFTEDKFTLKTKDGALP